MGDAMIERRLLRFDHELLDGLELPCFDARGTKEGPHVCVLGGVHGGEYSSIAAVIRFMNVLESNEWSGRITAVPIVSLPSFRGRVAFTMPQDGKNLNRCFPGSYDGTYSEVLARFVFDELIRPSDALIDLHGGDLAEALAPFVLYDASDVEQRARELAIAYNLPYVVRSVADAAPIGGTTSAAAAAAGIPAVLAEAGGCGLVEEAAVHTHLSGTCNVFRRLGMFDGEVTPPQPGMRGVGRFEWLRSTAEGWWEPTVRAGDEVRRGATIGTVKTLFGETIDEFAAPDDGIVLVLTTSPAVEANGLLLGLGAELAAID